MVRVAVYARISDDREGKSLGVQRQQDDCCRLLVQRGWTLGGMYVDNDVSAYKRHARRPAFQRLLADLEEAAVGGVVVYDLDRLARQPRDLERLLDVYDGRTGLAFATVTGDVDLGSPDGRVMARVMVAFANKSSADTGRRVARKHLELAQQGKPVGGGPRPFGFERDRVSICPDEARVLRDAAARVLSGESLTSVAKSMTRAGCRTSTGKDWTYAGLRQTLLSPRVAGFRRHRGILLRDAAGEPVQAIWQPILDRETYEGLAAVLTRLERRTSPGRRPGRVKYLLVGLLRCGRCGQRLYGRRNSRASSPGAVPTYTCDSPRGCRGCRISMSWVDALVTDAVQARLAAADLPEVEAEPWHGVERLAETREQIREVMAAFTERRLSAGVVFPAVERLEAEADSLEAERLGHAAAQQRPIAPLFEDWLNLDLPRRQAVLMTLMKAVVVRPAAGRDRNQTKDPARVEIAWR